MIVNLTPHAITLRGKSGDTTIPASGQVARVSNTPGAVQDSPLSSLVEDWSCDQPGEVENLPDPVEGVFLVVSGMVGDALRARGVVRPDVRVPGTGPQDGAIRNEKGHIVAVTRLKRI
jgi:hypothetical protein